MSADEDVSIFTVFKSGLVLRCCTVSYCCPLSVYKIYSSHIAYANDEMVIGIARFFVCDVGREEIMQIGYNSAYSFFFVQMYIKQRFMY